MIHTRIAFAAAAFGALCATAGAQTLFSFEGTINPWTSQTPANATLALGTIGATHGVNSLAITHNGGFVWIYNEQAFSAAAAINGKTFLTYDLTIDPDLGGAGWFNQLIAFNDAGGWRQTASNHDLPLTPGTHTVNVDISSLQPVNPTNWFQIFIAFNGPTGFARTFYVDNIRVVPEPASLAVFGVGAVALLLRRRK